MSRQRLVLIVDVVLLIAVLSLVLAACGPPQNPQVYQEGKRARGLFNQLLADARDFLSGFCGTAPIGIVVVSLSVMALRKRET